MTGVSELLLKGLGSRLMAQETFSYNCSQGIVTDSLDICGETLGVPAEHWLQRTRKVIITF